MPDTFTWNLDFGSQAQFNPTVRTTKFNDGYEQRQKFGINALTQSWPVMFSNRSTSEINAILAFLKTQGGVNAFNFTTPFGETILIKCSKWNGTPVKYNINTVTATFEQVFDT